MLFSMQLHILREKKKDVDGPGGVLNFHFGMSVRPKGPKIGA